MGDETDRNYENQWDEFFSVRESEAADGASSSTRRKMRREIDTVKKGRVSPTKLFEDSGLIGKNSEALQADKSKWDLIPDDELYELNAHELSTII
jgi:hypothetical protein